MHYMAYPVMQSNSHGLISIVDLWATVFMEFVSGLNSSNAIESCAQVHDSKIGRHDNIRMQH